MDLPNNITTAGLRSFYTCKMSSINLNDNIIYKLYFK